LLVKKYMPATPALKWIIAGAAVFIVLVLIIIVPLALIWQMGVFNLGGTATTEYRADYATIEAAQMPVFKAMKEIGAGEGAITVPTRTGVLPVKLELPTLGKSIAVKNDLVTKENQVELKLLLVSTNLKYLGYLLGLACLAICTKQYKKTS